MRISEEGNILQPDRRVLAVYLVGVFMGALDTSILSPALPLIAHSFATTLAWTAWTITAYTVAYAASTILAGAMGDRSGRRQVFALGILLFGIASMTAALSHSLAVFLVARVIQGAGAGAVYPNAQAEGVLQFGPQRRGTALGIFGAVFGLAAIVGPNVGGALAQYLGWPSIFLVNVPIAVAVLLMVRSLPASPTSGRALPDWGGGLAFAGLLGSGLLAIAAQGPARLLFILAALVLLVVFLWRQRGAATPFLDPSRLRTVAGWAMLVGAALIGLDLSASIFVPTLVQRVFHFSVLGSGVALMPAALFGAILAGAGGVLVDRVGARWVLEVGLFLGVVGGVLLAWPHRSFLMFILAMSCLGAATAFTMGAPLNRMAMAYYRTDQAGEALSMVAVFRAVGLAAGPVLLTGFGGFTGMFGTVAVASALGMLIFLMVPDVRPAVSRASSRPARAR